MKLAARRQHILTPRFSNRHRNPRIEEDALKPSDLGFLRGFERNRTGGIEGNEVDLPVSTPEKSRKRLRMFGAIIHVSEQDVFVGHAPSARRWVGVCGRDDILQGVFALDRHQLSP